MIKGEYELFIPLDEENKVLHSLDETYTKVSEMSNEEREFLNGIILRNQPKKLLEVGVSAGSSSVIILNAIKNNSDARLFSIDYLKNWYRNGTKNTGYVVNSYPDLQNKWKLFTGGLSLNFMEEIGSDIDLCLIDTVHSNPGELLDTLMVLPFLKDDAIMVFHDVNCHTGSKDFAECDPLGGFTNNLLFSAITGKKYLQGNFLTRSPYANWDKYVYFPNIGAIKINTETKKHIFEIFNLLTLKWVYLPTIEEERNIIQFFSNYYDAHLIDYLRKIFIYHRECFEHATTFTTGYFTREVIKLFIRIAKKLLKILIGANNYQKLKKWIKKTQRLDTMIERH
jgi:predicted O-methyltransferase YrrM